MQTKLLTILFLATIAAYAQDYSNVPPGVPTTGLLAYYPFDTNAANAVDHTGSSLQYDLGQIASPASAPAIAFPSSGGQKAGFVTIPKDRALRTTNFHNYFNSSATNANPQFTIAFWMKRGSSAPSDPGTLGSFIEMFESFYFRGSQGGYGISSANGSFNTTNRINSFSHNQTWVHYAFVFEPSSGSGNAFLRVYVNGVQRSGIPVTNYRIHRYTQNFLLGIGTNGGNNWDFAQKAVSVDFDEMYFYARALSVAEVGAIVNATDAGLSTATINDAAIAVYPNPFVDQVHVTLPAGTTQAQATIYSLSGQQLAQKTISTSDSVIENLQQLAAGVYLLEVHFSDNQRATYKIIK